MSNCPFCDGDRAADSPEPKSIGGNGLIDRLRCAGRSTQWLFPATLLVIMPKCPFCVVAYVALFTGVGITVSTARWMQVLLFVLCCDGRWCI